MLACFADCPPAKQSSCQTVIVLSQKYFIGAAILLRCIGYSAPTLIITFICNGRINITKRLYYAQLASVHTNVALTRFRLLDLDFLLCITTLHCITLLCISTQLSGRLCALVFVTLLLLLMFFTLVLFRWLIWKN